MLNFCGKPMDGEWHAFSDAKRDNQEAWNSTLRKPLRIRKR